MNRTLIGILLGAILLAALIYTTIDQSGVECRVCMDFEGRSACESARGPDLMTARSQATTGACTFVSSGVTDSMRCSSTQPTLVECTGGEEGGY